ncbi:MAG TPA: DUF2569 domain-containing protein [Sphingobium sp.]|jgi:hypothetical protein|nr:DUF2569 domain-containing protein [Sphingobium sp.]
MLSAWPKLNRSIAAWADRRGRAVVSFVDFRLEPLIPLWIGTVVLIAFGKILPASMPARSLTDVATMLLPFLLVALSPIVGYRVALGCFPFNPLASQPSFRLCRLGSWRRVDPLTARANPAFGPHGFMASLLAGLLLNVPFRTAEFLAAVPAIGTSAPAWAQVIMNAMVLDVIIMNFFYIVCFVMALRAAPLFPRMLLFVWVADIMMQLSIAQAVASAPDLPSSIGPAVKDLLLGNIQKVLISATLWLPYLILSDRINITFRARIRA